MITIFRNGYILLLSYNPCDIFDYFSVDEMHGLSYTECDAYANTKDSAYIAGWSNFVPKVSGEYISNDDRFVFINLSRCTDPVKTMGLIMHHLMHNKTHCVSRTSPAWCSSAYVPPTRYGIPPSRRCHRTER